MGILVCSVLFAGTAFAGIPSLVLSTAASAEANAVSVFTLPNGGGHRIDDCFLSGGAKTDATITLTLVDLNGDPINLYPFEDLTLATASGGLVTCPGGSTADASTDINGQCTFSGSVFGGGASGSGEGTIVLVNGSALTQAPMNVSFNSPDISGDLIVNLSDISLFASFYYGSYSYSADFYWDGNLNLSDISLLAQGNGSACP
jgi:hypothetical protein